MATSEASVPVFVAAQNEEFRLMTGDALETELRSKDKKRIAEAQFEIGRRAQNKARKRALNGRA